jgi:WD40 repeat protein
VKHEVTAERLRAGGPGHAEPPHSTPAAHYDRVRECRRTVRQYRRAGVVAVNVFISYAREDREFARRLVAALKGRGRESWVDWEGIEPSDEWWRSITEAIDAAEAVIVVTSPDSLVSEVCKREIAHAAAQHKRLVPVVCGDAEGLEIPAEIAELNWVFLRDSDNWEEGISTLERALELDIELIRVHTRVLTRAEAWRLAGRKPSPLLRGEDLRAAEHWLALAAAGGEPHPTELQMQFVVASRQMSSRRQRQAVIGAMAVAALAIGLSVFAFIQRAQAQHQARLAESRQLAATADAELGTDPENAIALAARGVRVEATPEAIHALSAALTASRLRADLRGPSPVESVAFSPDGSELAVGSDDGAVRVWRLADRRVVWTEGLGGPPATGVAFSHAGDVLVVARSAMATGKGCSAEVLDAAAGTRRRTLGPPRAGTCSNYVAMVGTGRTVAVGADSGTVQLWNIDEGQPLGNPLQMIVSGPDVANFDFEAGLAVSEDGQRLAALGGHVVQVDDLRSGARLATIRSRSSESFNPHAVAFSPDGSKLLISGEFGTEAYNIAARTASAFYSQAGETQSAAWSTDGRVLAAGAGFLGVDVWSRSSRLVEVLHGSSTAAFEAVAFSSTGLLAGGSTDGSVRIWSPDPDAADHTLSVPNSPDLAYGAPAVGLAAVGDPYASRGVVVVDDLGRKVRSLTLVGDVHDPNAGDAVGPFAVGSQGVLAFTRAGTLQVVQLRSGQPVRSWGLPSGAASVAIAVSADGTAAATLSSTGTLTVVSSRGPQNVSVPLDGGTPAALSMSPDGSLLAITTASGVRILAASTLQRLRTEPGVSASFPAGAGGLIAVQRSDLSIAILDTSSWQPRATVGGERTTATNLSFSPDNRLLAAVGNDGVLRVWDASDGTLLATRQLIESGRAAQMNAAPPVVLTAAGYAQIGDGGDSTVKAYQVCDQCLSPSALLTQADQRLSGIKPIRAN